MNELFFDAMVRHQIGLSRFSGSVRNSIWELLNRTEDDLASEILKRTERAAGVATLSPATLKRLAVLEKVIKELRGSAIDKAYNVWSDQMRELVVHEAAFLNSTIRTLSPVALDLVTPSNATLKALVSKQPFQGKTMKQWAASLKAADSTRIMDQIKIGLVQGETSQQLVARVRGTKALNYTNGVTEITRREAESITRTAVNHFSNQSKKEVYQDNADIVDTELYVATLDARTTPVCRGNDGKRFKVGEGPRPPLHFRCRSLRVAIFDDQVLGERPMKPVTEKMLVKEYAEKKGYTGVKNRDDLPHGTKGAFDKYAQKRVRELVGIVPASTSYQQFLLRQSTAFQDEVLGKTKAKLFRKGGLTLDKFVDRQGNELTLPQLAKREKQAFIDAGLDPADY